MKSLKTASKNLTSALVTAALVVGSVIATSSAAQAAAPGNNSFASATVLTPASPSLSSQTNVEATEETNEYRGTGNGANAWASTVWYSWTPAATGTSTIDLCNANFKAIIAVYSGATALPTTTPGATNIAENTGCSTTNGAKLNLDVTSGTNYKIQIGGIGGSGVNAGTFNLNISAPTSYTELDRVTICHRTHATTNPYRMITVSVSSIVGSAADGSPIRGHAKHATDARRYDPALYGVYDSTKTYRSNAKLWGDIIPPFKDKATGGVFPGLNWSWGNPTAAAGAGGQVFDKTAFGTVTQGSANAVHQSAVDACKGTSGNLTARQLFDLERKNGEKRQDILDEIAETDAFESDPANKEKTVLDSQLPAREGPKNVPANPIAQSLSGNVWLDINRNGFQEDNEPDMSNIRVTVQSGTPVTASGTFTGFGTGARVLSDLFGANALTSALDSAINSLAPAINYVRGLLGMATTYTVYTDVNGFYIFKSLAAGEWYATGTVPSGLDVTYDSSGVSDATADTVVPVGGHAFTWIGLMGDSSTGIKSLVKNPDGTPATKDVVLTYAGPDGKYCSDDDVNYVLTPVNGVIEMAGITAGNYYVRQIGTTGTIADLTVTSGAIYTTDITTTAGVRCAVLTDSETAAAKLAATGGLVENKAAGALGLLLVGLFATFIGVRRSRVTN